MKARIPDAMAKTDNIILIIKSNVFLFNIPISLLELYYFHYNKKDISEEISFQFNILWIDWMASILA